MATSDDIANLEARRTAIYAELAALNSSVSGGGPNINGGGLGTVDHVGYKDGLYRELKQIDNMLNSLRAENDGPWEVPLEGLP